VSNSILVFPEPVDTLDLRSHADTGWTSRWSRWSRRLNLERCSRQTGGCDNGACTCGERGHHPAIPGRPLVVGVLFHASICGVHGARRMTVRFRDLKRIIQTPLYANAYALVANQAISAVLGLLYWMLAARLYGVDTVGASSLAISMLLLVSGIAQLGLGDGMKRFLPRAGLQTRRLIVLSYGAVIAASVLLSVSAVALRGVLNLSDVLGRGSFLAAWMVLAAVLWAIFVLQDAVLVGLRQAKWVLIENTLYNIMKIAFLVLGARYLAKAGIVGSWFLPAPIGIALVTWLVFGVYTRADRIELPPASGLRLTVREVAASSGGDHIGSLVAEAASRLLPLLIVTVLGTAANAYFFQAWLIKATLGLVASAMAGSFTAEAAADMPRISRHSRDILRHMAMLIIPVSLVIGVGAPLILTLFGKSYAAEGATLLRWLCLASPLLVFNNWYLAYARVVGRIQRIILVQTVGAVLLLGLSYAFLHPLGITGVGIAWILSQSATAVVGLLDSRSVLFGAGHVEGGTTT